MQPLNTTMQHNGYYVELTCNSVFSDLAAFAFAMLFHRLSLFCLIFKVIFYLFVAAGGTGL